MVDTMVPMKTKIARWGNSLALRIPKHLAESRNLTEGADVEILEDAEELRLRPQKKQQYDLDELLEKVTPRNHHSSHWDDAPQGKEAW